MKNKFTITITNVYGSKHYTVDQIIKKIALFIAFILIALIIFGIIRFSILQDELNNVENNQSTVLQNIKTIEENNLALKKETKQLNSKLFNIEDIIGTPDYNTWNKKTKLNKITINNLQKHLLSKQIPIGYPIKYTRVTAKYGWRQHPINQNREFHKGIDLKQKRGTPVKATADGIVTYAAFQGSKGYGNLIKIAHNYSFNTVYGHLKSIKVKYGSFVKRGDVIGYVGSTGLSTGPHLHYEVKFLNKTVDPIDFIQATKNKLKKVFLHNRSVPWQKIIDSLTNQKN